MGLKDSWKETGVGLGHAFRDLGKTLIKTAATGVKKADEWANGNDTEAKKAETSEAEAPTETQAEEKTEE